MCVCVCKIYIKRTYKCAVRPGPPKGQAHYKPIHYRRNYRKKNIGRLTPQLRGIRNQTAEDTQRNPHQGNTGERSEHATKLYVTTDIDSTLRRCERPCYHNHRVPLPSDSLLGRGMLDWYLHGAQLKSRARQSPRHPERPLAPPPYSTSKPHSQSSHLVLLQACYTHCCPPACCQSPLTSKTP